MAQYLYGAVVILLMQSVIIQHDSNTTSAYQHTMKMVSFFFMTYRLRVRLLRPQLQKRSDHSNSFHQTHVICGDVRCIYWS